MRILNTATNIVNGLCTTANINIHDICGNNNETMRARFPLSVVKPGQSHSAITTCPHASFNFNIITCTQAVRAILTCSLSVGLHFAIH